MKNAAKNIRQLYRNTLDTINYSGVKVPIYQSFPTGTLPNKFIEITSVDTSNVLNDNKFITEASVTIEVVTKQYKFQDKTIADEITESVLNLVVPGIGGNLTDIDFIVGHVQLESSRYLEEIDEQGMYITRKILIFTQTLIEK